MHVVRRPQRAHQPDAGHRLLHRESFLPVVGFTEGQILGQTHEGVPGEGPAHLRADARSGAGGRARVGRRRSRPLRHRDDAVYVLQHSGHG